MGLGRGEVIDQVILTLKVACEFPDLAPYVAEGPRCGCTGGFLSDLDEMREGRITLVLVAPRCDTCGYFPWYKFPGALDEKTVRRLFKLLNDGLKVFKRR